MPISINNTLGQDDEQQVFDPIAPEVADDSAEQISAENIQGPAGLSEEEHNDPNAIKVCVSDDETPIVVLYGPPSCGKTMTLVRLTRYLVDQGYTVVPDRSFRPAADTHYKQLCDSFNQMINANSAATSTKNISFLLVKVLMDGRPVCQILEAPGEYYFHPKFPERPYPAYFHEIKNRPNRKVWAIMVEPDWQDPEPRRNYVTRISKLKAMMTPRDKVLFVYNKIDLTPYVYGVGQVKVKEAVKDVKQKYPGVFREFENKNPITKFWKKYNCEFVPFMTGSYSKTLSGGFAYTEGHHLYAQRLWEKMLEFIKG